MDTGLGERFKACLGESCGYILPMSAESFEADDDYVIVDRGNYRVRVHKKNLDRFNRSTMHKIHSERHKEGLMYDEETSRWIPLEAESFGAESFEATKGQKDYNYSYGDWDDSIYGVQIYDTDMKLKDVKKMLKDAGIKTKKPVASLARDYGFYFIIDKSQA